MASPRGSAPILTLSLVLLLLLAAVFTAAARSPETAVPTTTFRGPRGTLHDTEPRIQRPPAVVPLGHWSYPLLGQLVTRGVIDLDLTTLPVSRREVLDALMELDPVLTGRSDGPTSDAEGRRTAPTLSLTPRERWLIERLFLEFDRAAVDAPTAHVREGDAQLGMGMTVSVRGGFVGADHTEAGEVTPQGRPATGSRGGARGDTLVPAGGDSIAIPSVDDDFGIDAVLGYEIWGGFGDDIGFYSNANIVFHGQEGDRIERVSNRARAWRGMTADIVHGYLMVERPHWRVTAGRFGAAWGRSDRGRLLISGNAPTLDGVEMRASIGPISFTALNAMLEYTEIGTETDPGVDEHVFLAGHRLVIAGPKLSVGLNEAVVYSGAIPDPIYLNPFAPYYVSQHNERADDNIFWSLDVDWRPLPGHELYSELLADDLQYDRDTDNPDKYAATFGYRFAGVLLDRTDIELTLEYSQARKWTYTHKHVEHRLEHDGVPLGFDLGPDAERFLVEALIHPRRNIALGFEYVHARKGEGSLRIPYDKETDNPDTEFPSGDVRAVDSVRLSLEYDDLRGFESGISAGYYRVEGSDPADESIWEVTGHVGFRI